MCCGLLGNAGAREEGAVDHGRRLKQAPGQLLHPPNRAMRPQGGALHHILRKLPLYPHFHLGPGLGLLLFHFQVSEDKSGQSCGEMTVISQPSRAGG